MCEVLNKHSLYSVNLDQLHVIFPLHVFSAPVFHSCLPMLEQTVADVGRNVPRNHQLVLTAKFQSRHFENGFQDTCGLRITGQFLVVHPKG